MIKTIFRDKVEAIGMMFLMEHGTHIPKNIEQWFYVLGVNRK